MLGGLHQGLGGRISVPGGPVPFLRGSSEKKKVKLHLSESIPQTHFMQHRNSLEDQVD